MDKTSYTIPDFSDKITSIIKTPELIIHGYRFYCEIEITSEKNLHFFFHPLIRSFDFTLTINVKNASDGSIGDSTSDHISVDLDLSNTFELATEKTIEDNWLDSNQLIIEFQIEPDEVDYSPQLDFIFEILYGQIEGEEGLDETAIQWILAVSERILLSEPSVIKTNSPCVIIGDIHGQFYDIFRIFKAEGAPEDKKYIFLGDYVDRGYSSLNCILLLLALKIKNPKQCIIIRGNHEAENISSRYGFRDEVLIKFGATLYNDFIPVFNALPFAVLINEKIFCVHGGLSPSITKIEEVENIKRPLDPVEGQGAYDLIWSDPSTEVEEYGPNPRGSSFLFGKAPTERFLKENNLTLIIRAHQMMMDGYSYNFGEDFGLLTIFSASHYTTDNNKGGYAVIDEKGDIRLENYSALTEKQIEEFKEYNLSDYLAK